MNIIKTYICIELKTYSSQKYRYIKQYREHIHVSFQKTDSGDSGNEEPNGAADFYRKPAVGRRIPVPGTVPKVDKLNDRILTLTSPREYDKEQIPGELIESLPPEGEVTSASICFQ